MVANNTVIPTRTYASARIFTSMVTGGTKVLAYWVALGGKTQDKSCLRAKGHA